MKATWKMFYFSPEETLCLENAISEMVLFLFKNNCQHLRAEPHGFFEISCRGWFKRNVDTGHWFFCLEYKGPNGENDAFQTMVKYPELDGIKHQVMMNIVGERIRQLAAIRGYLVELGDWHDANENKPPHHYTQGWLKLTTKTLGD